MDINHQKSAGVAHQISGWIASLLGGLCILFALFVLLGEAGAALPNWYEGVLICTVPSMVVGIPLLVFGIRRIKRLDIKDKTDGKIFARKYRSSLIWGWVDTIVGGLLTLIGVTILYMTVALILPSEWDPSYFIFCLVCLLIGVPILTVGIRRLKQLQKYKNLNWGWITLVAGGLLTAGGTYLLLVYLFAHNPGPFREWILLIAPLLLPGFALIFIGIRKVEKMDSRPVDMLSQAVPEARRPTRLAWGWILTILGGVTILGSVFSLAYWIYIYFFRTLLEGYIEPYVGFLWELLFVRILILTLPLMVAGMSLLVPGVVLIKKYEISRQARGWILVGVAVMYLLSVIIAIAYEMTGKYTLIRTTPIYSALFLILGLLCLLFGIRDVHREETSPTAPEVDNPFG